MKLQEVKSRCSSSRVVLDSWTKHTFATEFLPHSGGSPSEGHDPPRSSPRKLASWRGSYRPLQGSLLEGFCRALQGSADVQRDSPRIFVTLGELLEVLTPSRFLGRGCDEALFSERKKGFSVNRGEAFSA